MFKVAVQSWQRYSTLLAQTLLKDDARHDLSAEVRIRLEQLDLILRYLEQARSNVRPDPQEMERRSVWIREDYPARAPGELSIEEWIAGISGPPRSRAEIAAWIDAWDSVRLFTEAFYFFAWRLLEVLNRRGPYDFPHLERVKAKGINEVPNELLEHPERASKNFKQSMMVTDTVGPVLHTTDQ